MDAMPYISFAHPTFQKVARVMTFNEFQNAGEFLAMMMTQSGKQLPRVSFALMLG